MVITYTSDSTALVGISHQPTSGQSEPKCAGRSIINCIASIALALSPSTGAKAATSLSLIIAGPWTLTGDDGQCFLTRKYLNGTSTLNLRIDQFPREYGFRTTISFEHPGAAHRVVSAKIRPDGTTAKPRSRLPIEVFNESDGLHQAYRIFLIQDDLDYIGTRGLFVMPSGHAGFDIPVPHLAEAIIELRRCEQVMIETSGLPQQAMRRIKSFPEYNGKIKINSFDQMHIEKNADPEDVAVARAIIDKTGLPISCEIIHKAKSTTLDVEACRRITLWKFNPAIDTSGNPMLAPVFAEAMWPFHD